MSNIKYKTVSVCAKSAAALTLLTCLSVTSSFASDMSVLRETAIRDAGLRVLSAQASGTVSKQDETTHRTPKIARVRSNSSRVWGPHTDVAMREPGTPVLANVSSVATASASEEVGLAPKPAAAVPNTKTASLASVQVPAPVAVQNEPDPEPELFVLVLVGDTGLNAHNQKVRPTKALRHGRGYDWSFTTKKIASLIDGHVNFANIETVVTDHNKHYPSPKSFNFRMHTNAARHLVDVGFNVFSLANNHSADYGRDGVRDTLKHTERLRTAGLRAYAGLGLDRDDAIKSQNFSIGQARFGFAAMGIGARSPGAARAGDGKPGQVNIYGTEDFNAVVDDLVARPADYRILSMHFGAERNVRPLPGQVKKWRDEVLIGRGIDLIVGHHAHVVQGVQMTDGKLIFYGLGNFLHMGMQDMSKFNACRDYGLLARVFVVRQADGTMEAQAVQVVPLTDMHLQARPLTGKAAGRRIDVLNMLAEELDDQSAGAHGVRFAKQVDGTGLYCRPGAENGPGRLGALCRDYVPAPTFTSVQRRRVRGLCGATPSRSVSRRVSKRRSTTRKSRRKAKVWTGRKIFNKR